jgi:hypothetical protein
MKRNWMAMLVIAGGFDLAMFGQQYPQQDPRQYPADQGAPNYNGQGSNGRYDNGEYSRDPGYGAYNGDPAYDDSDQGVYAPAPPPVPSYAYQRPPMPGPGYYWVDLWEMRVEPSSSGSPKARRVTDRGICRDSSAARTAPSERAELARRDQMTQSRLLRNKSVRSVPVPLV